MPTLTRGKLSKIPKHPFLTYWDRRICKMSLHSQNNLIVDNCAYSHSWEVVQNPQTPLSYLLGQKDLQDEFTLAKQSDCRQLCLLSLVGSCPKSPNTPFLPTRREGSARYVYTCKTVWLQTTVPRLSGLGRCSKTDKTQGRSSPYKRVVQRTLTAT